MNRRKLGSLQLSVLALVEKHEGRICPELIYQEMYGHPAPADHGERGPIDAETRNTVSRVLWSLEKRGLLRRLANSNGFEQGNPG